MDSDRSRTAVLYHMVLGIMNDIYMTSRLHTASVQLVARRPSERKATWQPPAEQFTRCRSMWVPSACTGSSISNCRHLVRRARTPCPLHVDVVMRGCRASVAKTDQTCTWRANRTCRELAHGVVPSGKMSEGRRSSSLV